VKRIADVPVGAPIIMLGENSVINSENYFKKYNIESNKNFGQLGVYIIKIKNNNCLLMLDKTKEYFRKITKQTWILLAIILLGTFLRAYNLNDWLDFGDDQVHDAILVEAVVRGETAWPLLGPDMSKSGNGSTEGSSRENRFHIGPVYYYFQILSAKMFGTEPYRLAYPDLLFSILSIPLFFIF
jgi:hypothetical protein